MLALYTSKMLVGFSEGYQSSIFYVQYFATHNYSYEASSVPHICNTCEGGKLSQQSSVKVPLSTCLVLIEASGHQAPVFPHHSSPIKLPSIQQWNNHVTLLKISSLVPQLTLTPHKQLDKKKGNSQPSSGGQLLWSY